MQVILPDGRLGWSAVYMFSHMEEAGEFPYIRLTTAGGTQVCVLRSPNPGQAHDSWRTSSCQGTADALKL